ncbi:MAG: Ku protein [Rhodospirillales bacterium]
MAARPYWRGQLRLALVSCPIRLIPATTGADKVRFHKLSRDTGNRLRQQMVDEETGEVVERDETVMGYEFDKGRYVTVEKEEIDALKIESSETIDIERVVAASAVDCLYLDTPYIVEPDGKTGLDVFATIREAIGRKDVVGIGRAVMARRERAVAVQARGKGMIISTLRDPDEVRNPDEIFDDIKDVKINGEYLSMAEMLIERMTGKFDLSMFEDRYQEALRTLVEARMKGKKTVVAAEPERPTNVVNLFDALKASLEGKGGGDKKAPERRAAARRKPSSQAKGKKAAKPRQRKRA